MVRGVCCRCRPPLGHDFARHAGALEHALQSCISVWTGLYCADVDDWTTRLLHRLIGFADKTELMDAAVSFVHFARLPRDKDDQRVRVPIILLEFNIDSSKSKRTVAMGNIIPAWWANTLSNTLQRRTGTIATVSCTHHGKLWCDTDIVKPSGCVLMGCWNTQTFLFEHRRL